MPAYCKDFLRNKCQYDNCKFEHNSEICSHFYLYNKCKYGNECKKQHPNGKEKYNKNKERNKEIKRKQQQPLNEKENDHPIDMRILVGTYTENFDKETTTKDLVLCNNLFPEFDKWYIHNEILKELENYQNDNPEKQVWYGSETLKIAGCGFSSTYFNIIVDRLAKYFGVCVESTQLNWYKGSNEFNYNFKDKSTKDSKNDSKKDKYVIVASFGSNIDVSLKHSKTSTHLEYPVKSGGVYCFSNKINSIWRHKTTTTSKSEIDSEQSRISVILWGVKE